MRLRRLYCLRLVTLLVFPYADSIQNSPDTLIKKIQQQFGDEDFAGMNATIAELKKRHPDCPQVAIADSLKSVADEIYQKRTAEYKKAFESMRAETDKVTGTTWYMDKSSPQFVNRNGFFLLFNNYGSLQLKIQYYGEDWLFIEDYNVVTDYGTYSLNPGKVDRDNDSKVWEWCTIGIGEDHCAMVNDIARSKSVTVRMNGKQYKHDVELTSTQIKAFKNTLYAFRNGKHGMCD